MDELLLTLNNERAVGWNALYSGKMHWTDRASLVEYIHNLFIEHKAKYPLLGKKQLQKRVDINITAYFNKSPLDPDNIATKFYIDGLKGWLLIDDSTVYVRRVSAESKLDKENRIEIEIIIF